MTRDPFADVHPGDLDPETGRPYAGYSSPSLEPAFRDPPSDRSERAWLRWVASAEALAGHDLDGDNSAAAQAAGTACGYSLDEAVEAFERGETAAAYVASFRRAAA